MKNNNKQKLSKQVFLKYAPFDIKKEGDKRVRPERTLHKMERHPVCRTRKVRLSIA